MPGDYESRWDFDIDEKASWMLHEGETPEELPVVDAGDSPEVLEPETCPVRHEILMTAETVGEMMDRFEAHHADYCEACGQTEFLGYVRPGDWRKAA